MADARNRFLDHFSSDESDAGDGYDSEVAEIRKGATRTGAAPRLKRRKLSQSGEEGSDQDNRPQDLNNASAKNAHGEENSSVKDAVINGNLKTRESVLETNVDSDESDIIIKSASAAISGATKPKSNKKPSKPGVVYLSSLPPYLKPSALRNLLQQRGFEPISRLFLSPASKAKSTSKKNSRQLYTEGWIEFSSKKTARRCAEALNANIIGGKKGGFYHDDLWNMKYLKGMAWDELMAGIREERREEEGRRDEERRTIAKETQRFLDGVEEGKRVEGMKRKRKEKGQSGSDAVDQDAIKRTWRQFEVKGKSSSTPKQRDKLDGEVQAVLAKIF